MKAMGKELKWGLCGFVAGFVLCYIVVGAMETPPSQSRVALMGATTPASRSPVIIHLEPQSVDLLSAAAPHPRENPFRRSAELRNVPRGTLPDTYSVELIDGRDR